jgi:formylglycine-generating enzyme required for sulfatase activity
MNSGDETHPVGQLKPNAWGLYDMHGNVWEWCQDLHDAGAYKGRASGNSDPLNLSTGAARVLRGGSWGDGPDDCRAACRGFDLPDSRNDAYGFRVCF